MASNPADGREEGSAEEFQTVPSKRSSTSRKRLFVGNLPRSMSKLELIELLRTHAGDYNTTPTTTTTTNNNNNTWDERQIELVTTKQCQRAFVSALENHTIQTLISMLDQSEIGGRRIHVQWEQPRKPERHHHQQQQQQQQQQPPNSRSIFSNNKDKRRIKSKDFGFMSKSWSKPSDGNHLNGEDNGHEDDGGIIAGRSTAPSSFQEASERVESIVREQQQQCWKGDGVVPGMDDDDSVRQSCLLAATAAAVSLVAAGGFNVRCAQDDDNDNDCNDGVPAHIVDDNKGEDNNNNNNNNNTAGLLALLQPQSLATLLEDYGEFDPNWQNVKPMSPLPSTSINDSLGGIPNEGGEPQQKQQPQSQQTKESIRRSSTSTSRLGQHGKAPLHVVFVSFGYHYGGPSGGGGNNGNPYANPLPVYDTRDFPPLPPHLCFGPYDGLSGLVRRIALDSTITEKITPHSEASTKIHAAARPSTLASTAVVEKTTMTLRQYTRTMAVDVETALVEAMNDGGYGYAQPLHVTINVGSVYGRHRSVVAAEAAAAALRQRLRNNTNDRFRQPVSVGTQHRDITKVPPSPPTITRKQKQQLKESTTLSSCTTKTTSRRKNALIVEDNDDDW